VRMALGDELAGLIPSAEPEEPDADEAFLEEVRAEVRAELGLPANAPLDTIQAACADIERCWEVFFAHFRADPETGAEIPGAQFHVDFRARLQALVRGETTWKEIAVAYPRECAKSVNASLLLPIWAGANKLRRFAFLFSDTDTQAWGLLEDIRLEIDTNDRLRAIYPEFCAWDGKPRVNRLVCANGFVVMAAGSGKSVRGARKRAQRPDLIVGDDLENDEEVANPERRRKKVVWWNKVVRKLGRGAVYVIVGTILHADSFLAGRVRNKAYIHRALVEMPTRMDLWDAWEAILRDRTLEDREGAALAYYLARRHEMDAGATVLWPDRFGLYELMVERAEDLASFLSERQNDPFDPRASWFPEESFVWLSGDDRPALETVRMALGYWDPSRGTSKSDTSTTLRLEILPDGRLWVSAGMADKVPPETVMDTIIGYHRRRPYHVVGVERVGLSSNDTELQRRAREAGVVLPVEPVTPQGDKTLRIKSLRPLIVSGTLVFSDDLPLEVKKQLLYFPQHPHDDVPDCLEQLARMADRYTQDVPAASVALPPSREGQRVSAADTFGAGGLAGERPEYLSMLDVRFGDSSTWDL
jgi:predicted phage terminase large subunit-like protein